MLRIISSNTPYRHLPNFTLQIDKNSTFSILFFDLQGLKISSFLTPTNPSIFENNETNREGKISPSSFGKIKLTLLFLFFTFLLKIKLLAKFPSSCIRESESLN